MRVELIEHEDDSLSRGVVDINQLLNAAGEVEPCALLAHQHGAPAPQGLGGQKEVDDATADVLGIVPRQSAWLGWCRGANIAEELAAGLIQAHHRTRRVDGSFVDIEHIFQMPDEVRICGRRQTPLLAQVGLEIVFLSVWRTVSYEMVSTISRRTTSSASSRRLHWA